MSRLLPILLFAGLPLATLAEEPSAPARSSVPPPAARHTPLNSEQVAMQMVIRKLVLDRYDADNNLRLDGEERHRLMADAHAARKQQALAFIRRFDTNEDGELSPEEHAAMKQAMKERRNKAEPEPPRPEAGEPQPHRRPHAKRHPHHPPMGEKGRLIAILTHQLTMDAYDADKNGILDTEESAQLRADGAELYEARKAELLARFDKDGDGCFSPTELAAAQRELRPRRPQGGPPMPPAPPAARTEAPEGKLPPPPHHPGGNPFHRLLDTHFDFDILRHHGTTPPPAAEGSPSQQHPQPCAPSTPTAN